MRGLTLAATLVAALAAPAAARAQQPQPQLPKWDAGASFGLLFGDGWHPGADSYGEPHAAYHLELGRFWTTHLKSDAAVVLTHRSSDYDYTSFAPGGLGVYSFTEHERRLTALSGAATYQFFENAMMH